MTEQEKQEKVIKGLELCGYQEGMPQCDSCPYDGKQCWKRLKNDALALLKAQEPVAPIIDETGVFYCANCKKQPVGYKNIARDIFRHNLYCPKCGKKVKWDDESERHD